MLCFIIALGIVHVPCILPLPSGTYLASLYALSKSSALSKMGRLRALTFAPVIVMTFEFCQRGATVDTLFLTVLKTWTSPFEHSMIIHAHVRFEFSEDSAGRLASSSLNLTVSCLVEDQGLVVFAPKGKKWLVGHPSTHRPWPEATGHFSCHRPNVLADRHFIWSAGPCVGRSAIFAGRTLFICFMQIFYTSWRSWHPQLPPTIHVCGEI